MQISSQINQQNHHYKDKNILQQSQQQPSITMIENYIQQKQFQVNNLQNYLIKEFQNIQNSKNRNKKIENFMKNNLVSIFNDIKHLLTNIKILLDPILTINKEFVINISQKCRYLLENKQKQNENQQKIIIGLTNEVQKLKMQNEQIKGAILFQFKEKQQNNKPNIHHYQQYNQKVFYDKSSSIQTFNATIKKQKQVLKIATSQNHSYKKQDNNIMPSRLQTKLLTKTFNKTPNKSQKRQQPSQKTILQCQNTNVIYKCDRLSKNKNDYSPKSGSVNENNMLSKNQEEQKIRNRKQQIKQKIQKIKIKTQLKYTNFFL